MKYFLSLLAVAGCAAAQPVITAVQDGGAYTNNVAQGSVFVVKGTGLSASGYVPATAPSYPTTLNNVQITFTPAAGGTAINALMAYTYNQGGVNQLAAVLKSTVATGAYDVKVINNGATSAAFRTNVVASKPGIVTASSDGQGQAQATLNDGGTLIRNSNVGAIGAFATRAAHPGDYVILWGTGLGPDASSDTGGSAGNQTAAWSARVLLDGTEITPQYAGRSQGYPGLDQIVFILPANMTLSCANAVQVRSNGVLSNPVTIASAAAGSDACTPPSGGGGGGGNPILSQSEIDSILNRGKFRVGYLTLSRSSITTPSIGGFGGGTTNSEFASGMFQEVTGLDLRNSLQGTSSVAGYVAPADGVCIVYSLTQTQTSFNPTPNLQYRYLDAGANLTLQSPGGSRVMAKSTSGSSINYNSDFTAGFLVNGSYTISGTGGPDVGAFSVTSPLAPTLNWTNSAAVGTTTRASGMPLTWTGGDPTQLLYIFGYSTDQNGAGKGFLCYANQSRGSFTVPASILTQLPASTSINAGPGLDFAFPGSVYLESISATVRGNAPNLDAVFMTSVGIVGVPVTFK